MFPRKSVIEGESMIGFITIGQTPRDDLLLPYEEILTLLDYQMVGVLDGMKKEDIPPCEGKYPLITKLSDGEFIHVEKDYLEKKMEHVIFRLERDGVKAIVLLCAGDFEIDSKIPILQPNRLTPFYMNQFTKKNTLGIVIPIDNQQNAAHKKWAKYGFKSNTLTVSMDAISLNYDYWNAWDEDQAFDTILFDCAGYSPTIIKEAKRLTKKQVYGTDELIQSTIKTFLNL